MAPQGVSGLSRPFLPFQLDLLRTDAYGDVLLFLNPTFACGLRFDRRPCVKGGRCPWATSFSEQTTKATAGKSDVRKTVQSNIAAKVECIG